MAKYVDGFVLPVPSDKVAEYKKIAEKACKIWLQHGALEYVEAIGDDLNSKDMLSFHKLAGTKPGETVVFAWITYESKEHRDAVNKKVMEDPEMKNFDPANMPFDWKRMAYGGFSFLVSGNSKKSSK